MSEEPKMQQIDAKTEIRKLIGSVNVGLKTYKVLWM